MNKFLTNKYLKKRYFVFFWLLLFFILMWTILSYFDTQKIVSYIWIENTYFIIFLIAAIGWFSSISWYPLVAIMATFISWGSNFLLIGLLAWIWIMFGDSLFYYFGIKSRDVIEGKTKKYVDIMSKFLNSKNKYATPIIIYIYSWWTPLPNDILTISVGISWYPYKKAFIPLFLWNITHMLLYSFFIYYWIWILSN